jgi:hypothetical protein
MGAMFPEIPLAAAPRFVARACDWFDSSLGWSLLPWYPRRMASASASSDSASSVSALLIGPGQYTTGFGKESEKSDKRSGVVLLAMLQLKKDGLVGDIALAGTDGTKVRALRCRTSGSSRGWRAAP